MFRSVSLMFPQRIFGVLAFLIDEHFLRTYTYDAEGRVVKRGDLDPEAQQIGDEFKHTLYPN